MAEIDTKYFLTKHFKFSPSTCTVTLTKQPLFEKKQPSMAVCLLAVGCTVQALWNKIKLINLVNRQTRKAKNSTASLSQ